MPTTHLSLHYHIVFSTKERRAIINDEWRGQLHAFLGGCLKTINAVPEAIGGTRDPRSSSRRAARDASSCRCHQEF